MKNIEEVKKAIEFLKANTENDFEKLSVERLETALFDPPQIEIIDETHQKFNGVVYAADKGGHYSNHCFIHRAVWEFYNGAIPEKGYAIHHIDFDKSNNQLSNLQLLSKAEHSSIHAKHHKPHLRRSQKVKKICVWCGKEFSAINTGKNRFCSHSCANAFSAATNPEEKICVICGKTFLTKKHSQTKTCSPLCKGKLSKLTWEMKRNAKHIGKSEIERNTAAVFEVGRENTGGGGIS